MMTIGVRCSGVATGFKRSGWSAVWTAGVPTNDLGREGMGVDAPLGHQDMTGRDHRSVLRESHSPSGF
jgi:hypothetical protein